MRITLIGSGSLALGLLYPWISKISGHDICIVTRPPSDSSFSRALHESRKYRLEIPSEDPGSQSLDCEMIAYDPDDLDGELARTCIERLGSTDVAMVCVGVNALPRVAALIARSCLEGRKRPLHLLAFENAPNASRGLLELVEREIQSLGNENSRSLPLVPHVAIPDRACSRNEEEGLVIIEAERFGEILLESSARELFAEIEDPSSPVPYVRHVDSHALTLAEKRKFWLVNGTHTALGVLCAISRRQLLADGLADEDVADLLRRLHEEWVRVLHHAADAQDQNSGIFSREELASHAERLFDRLEDLPEFSVKDVLKELALPEALEDAPPVLARLLQKLDDRLAQQTREAFVYDGGPVPFSGWMLATGVHVAREHSDTYLV